MVGSLGSAGGSWLQPRSRPSGALTLTRDAWHGLPPAAPPTSTHLLYAAPLSHPGYVAPTLALFPWTRERATS